MLVIAVASSAGDVDVKLHDKVALVRDAVRIPVHRRTLFSRLGVGAGPFLAGLSVTFLRVPARSSFLRFGPSSNPEYEKLLLLSIVSPD